MGRMMAKYEITIRDIEIYRLEIEAESEDEAMDKAYDKLEQDRNKYHCDSDEDYEITKIYE